VGRKTLTQSINDWVLALQSQHEGTLISYYIDSHLLNQERTTPMDDFPW